MKRIFFIAEPRWGPSRFTKRCAACDRTIQRGELCLFVPTQNLIFCEWGCGVEAARALGYTDPIRLKKEESA